MQISYIYIISSDNGMTKLGKANDPYKRLRQLITGNPNNCSISYTIPVPYEEALILEQKCHRLLSSKFESRSEWYNATADRILEEIKDLCINFEECKARHDKLKDAYYLEKDKEATLRYEIFHLERTFFISLKHLQFNLEDVYKKRISLEVDIEKIPFYSDFKKNDVEFIKEFCWDKTILSSKFSNIFYENNDKYEVFKLKSESSSQLFAFIAKCYDNPHEKYYYWMAKAKELDSSDFSINSIPDNHKTAESFLSAFSLINDELNDMYQRPL